MAEERDWEGEARKQGWRPKEEFDGPEDKWADAQTFVEKGEKIAGILKSKVDRLEERLAAAERANKEFGEYHKTQMEREKERSQRRIAELEAERAQAVTDGDGQKFQKLDREIDEERNKQQPQKNGGDNSSFEQQFIEENPWYGKDEDLTIYADGVSERIWNEGYRGLAYIREVGERVKKKHPDKFGNPKRNGANDVESGGDRKPKGSAKHSYEDLPPDAKRACDEFDRQGIMTRKDYVAAYEWEE